MPIIVPTQREYLHMNERQRREALKNMRRVAAMFKLPQFAAIDPELRKAQAWLHIYGVDDKAAQHCRDANKAVRGG